MKNCHCVAASETRSWSTVVSLQVPLRGLSKRYADCSREFVDRKSESNEVLADACMVRLSGIPHTVAQHATSVLIAQECHACA